MHRGPQASTQISSGVLSSVFEATNKNTWQREPKNGAASQEKKGEPFYIPNLVENPHPLTIRTCGSTGAARRPPPAAAAAPHIMRPGGRLLAEGGS